MHTTHTHTHTHTHTPYTHTHIHTHRTHTHTHTHTHRTHSVALPQITGRSGPVTILENNPTSTIFSYATVGIPQPHSYQWLRNGAPFQGNHRVRVTAGHNSSLEVRAPSREDSGSYTLVATSLAGQDTLTIKLQIACKSSRY